MELYSFGKRLAEVRKNKKISQTQLGKQIGMLGAVIGRYEREEVKPSIETATLIAKTLQTSLDYLVNVTDVEIDKDIQKRILEVSKFKEQDKKHIYAVIDAFIAKRKIENIM